MCPLCVFTLSERRVSCPPPPSTPVIVGFVIQFHTTVNSTIISLVLMQGLIERFVSDDVQLQISSLYATQVFCYEKQFPKGIDIIDHLKESMCCSTAHYTLGLLLRLFSYWYDMDVIEEETFLKWKEDLSQQYPGKGQALFQVSCIPSVATHLLTTTINMTTNKSKFHIKCCTWTTRDM